MKTLIAVGGWAHNDPNATTVHLFSKAVATAATRKKFIANILAFTAKYGFDGCAPWGEHVQAELWSRGARQALLHDAVRAGLETPRCLLKEFLLLQDRL